MRSKEVEEAINQLIVDINFSETGCSTGIIDVNNIETLLSYIEELEEQVENYMKLSASSLARGLNESIRANEKNKTELELLNEGWKQVIRDKIEEYQDNMKKYEYADRNIFNENNIRQEVITVLNSLLEGE